MGFTRIDFRYMEIEYELWALGHFLALIEPELEHLLAQDQQRTFAELRENGWDHDEAEVDLASQELSDRQRYVIPRFMRGPFIVSLWACFEAAVVELANGRKEEMGAKLALSDLKGDSFLSRAALYFQAVLNMPLDQDRARLARLKDLYLIRNSLAHANGQRHAMKPNKWKELAAALKRHGTPADEDRGFVILSDVYLKMAYEDINKSLHDLVLRVKAGTRRRQNSVEQELGTE